LNLNLAWVILMSAIPHVGVAGPWCLRPGRDPFLLYFYSCMFHKKNKGIL
jgi:hypothetical protein